MPSTTETASDTQPNITPESDAYIGAEFLKLLYEMTKTPEGRAMKAGGQMVLENIKLVGMGALSTRSQGVIISSVMIRKVMHMLGIAAPSQGIKCVSAIAKLGATGAILTAKVGATTVVTFGLLTIPTVFISLVILALESYDVGNACFIHNGNVSHALGI